ncbi:dockerin type I repeat-containing protein [Anaeromassilibacillus sp. An172]|uniref:dockerin type I repeat-containing protein n=1 Tax=Anaeromassilibacillus sp. An172 TaxID=1965570 RepID=UPI001FA88E38|nr:dockerin type I repeat-containing protein [Anaeromassilibacillus sp. An172]
MDGNKTTFVWLYSQAVNTNLTMNFDSTRAINYVEFVTTTDGGRFVGKANIEYLNEAGQWIVAGSINSDDFQDGATSITFEEVKAKGIRFVVTEAGSTNWLKVAEFNAANTNAKNIITVNGVGETKLNDMDMRTFVNPTGEGEVVYNVYESAKVNSLRIYNAAGQWDGVSVYAVTEDGETELAVVEDKSNVNTHVYDVSALKGVKSFRIAFTDGIYLNEIETESDRFVALNTYEAEKKVDAAKVLSENTAMYTEDSLKVIKEKIAAVEALLADMAIGEPVTQEALDAAMADMAETVNNLEAVEGAFEMGDVNHSGIVDIDDATLIQMHLAKALGNTAFYKENADYSKDGKITVYDATLIQLMLAS